MAYNNIFIGSGTVDNYKEGTTQNGDRVCSFTLNMVEHGNKSWIRCNVYDMLADYCVNNLQHGDMVFVQGKVMNRRATDRQLAFTEVRCLNVQLLQKSYSDKENSTHSDDLGVA